MERDLYEVLGLKRDASADEVKRAYRHKAMSLHPERGGSPAAFAEAGEAYCILIDPKLRDLYDRTGIRPAPAAELAAAVAPASPMSWNQISAVFAEHGRPTMGHSHEEMMHALETGELPATAPLPEARTVTVKRGLWARLRGRSRSV